MEDSGNWWADVSSSEDEDFEELENFEEVLPGTGHHYSHPFTINGITVLTHGDFIYHMQDIYEVFIEINSGEAGAGWWANILAGMCNTSDPDDMDGASFEMVIALDASIVSPDLANLLSTTNVEIETMNQLIAEETVEKISSAVQELTLDVFDQTPEKTYYNIPSNYKSNVPVKITNSNMSAPPLYPVIPGNTPLFLVLASHFPSPGDAYQARIHWQDKLKELDPSFPAERIETYDDNQTIESSRSNTRPSNRSAVYIEYADGAKVNIGSHGYSLMEDQKLKLDIGKVDIALQELFSAPGGEGLTCPTPSHILHQVVSAILATMLDFYLPVSEEMNIDLKLTRIPTGPLRQINFDITTSAGIWNKSLSPTPSNPSYVYQAAVSKYDLAAIMLEFASEDSSKLIYRAVANCLHCEYPAHYRLDEENLSEDLKLQSAIYGKLTSLSYRKLQDLGALCYDAGILESGLLAENVDINKQGMPWKEKKEILHQKLLNVKPRGNVALPPIPLSDIVALPGGPISFDLLGHNFQNGDYIIQGRSQGPKTHIDDNDHFLMHFPVLGIVDPDSAKEIASILDSKPIKIGGLTHKGPSPEYSGPDSVYSEAANQAYSMSASAQLSEIRSDVARLIYKSPMPKKGKWVSAYIYKGKVSIWYRCRDNPVGSEGFRIDWFAVSAFPVIGSREFVTHQGHKLHMWPRQKLRSQELKLAHLGPRRLKLTLFSMLEKMNSCRSTLKEIISAWERLAITLNSSTWGSGTMFLTCRYLSTSFSSPSSPFHKMASKIESPKTFSDVCYLERLSRVIKSWHKRDQFIDYCPLLGLPRSYSQLESYWMLWVPSDFADSTRNMTLCVMGLYDEAMFLKETEKQRVTDLHSQYHLLCQDKISIDDLRNSLKVTCNLDTDGKLGWSWIGSLASGHALNLRASAGGFDRRYGRGTKARNITDHFTVRHSTRINNKKELKKGTVAEMMIDQGVDNFLSTVDQTYRFLYINLPTFFNHPKKGEHKAREISITDPDSRQALSDAELICGMYGKTTGVDFLKDPAKNAKFYRTSSRLMMRGGGIQSSDATRYGPSMSNFAIAIMLLYLGSYSMHLRWASCVYARLAYRQMLIPMSIEPYLSKLMGHEDTKYRASGTLKWISSMPIRAYEEGVPHVWYTTSHHMGQGMSHHSSSLLHAGGIIVAVDAVTRAQITVKGTLMSFKVGIMVTSDDSTLLVEPHPSESGKVANRQMRQIAARIFLQLIRESRKTALRMVSVLPNLVKEIISSIKGEFNSQDTGIGSTCPILGFREAISLLVVPSNPSLVGDYLNSHACAKDVALAGQGISTGCFMHHLMVDAIEERWGLNAEHKLALKSLSVLPRELLEGCGSTNLLSSPASMLNPMIRASMLSESISQNAQNEDLDPNTRDSVYAPLMHVKVAMSKQHRTAIKLLKAKMKELASRGYEHQAQLIQECLRSTLSSAKTRNLGRVAFKIASRNVVPRPYGEISFDKNKMLEQTLNWLKYINDKMISSKPSASDITLGNSVSGYIRLASTQRTNFPRPPEIRRFIPRRAVKPKYMTNNYGKTPFGQHALVRSGTSVVPAIGIAERIEMQKYLALTRHRKFSEHIEYGGSFVISWSEMSGARIIALDITVNWEIQMKEHIKRGDFSSRGISILKELAYSYDLPVLALHVYDGIRGLWHCVHKGQAYTVSYAFDIDNTHSNGIHYQMDTGEYVILGIQGFEEEAKWHDTVPTAYEIKHYQESDYFEFMPAIVRSIEDQNIVSGAATNVTYSTDIDHFGERTLIYVAPEITSTPMHNPNLIPRVKFLRAKVIASLSSAGYWHTSLRGVAFRAFLKDAWWENTIWPGGVIGWRQSSTSVPVYHTPTSNTLGVRALLVLGGYNSVDQVSQYNPDIFSEGYKAVCESNTLTYKKAIKVSQEMIPLILQANFGKRYHVGGAGNTFLDFLQADPAPLQNFIDPMDAKEEISRLLMGGLNPDDGF
jgi:hypothetical protein